MVRVIRPEENVRTDENDIPDDAGHRNLPLWHPPSSRLVDGGEPGNNEGAVGYSPNSDHSSEYFTNGLLENTHDIVCRPRSWSQYDGVCDSSGSYYDNDHNSNDSCQYLSRPVEPQVDSSDRENLLRRRRHSTSETYGNVTPMNQVSPIHGQEIRQLSIGSDCRRGSGSSPNDVEQTCNGYGAGIQHDHSESTRMNRARFRSSVQYNSSPSMEYATSVPYLNRTNYPGSFSRNIEERRGSFQAISNPRLEGVNCRRYSLQVDQLRETRGSPQSNISPAQPDTLSADHNHFAVNCFPSEVSRETALVGSDLFLMFLREEIEQRHLQPPDCLNPQQDIAPSSRALLGTSEFIQMGAQLRYVANEFAKSVHRQTLREQAEDISLENLDFSSFSELMFVIFQEGGVTYERIVVLFFFCADLAIRALREKLRARFHELTQWSQFYIMSKLSVWVEQQGGWRIILEHSVNKMYKAAIIGVCCMGMIACWIYIRNNFR